MSQLDLRKVTGGNMEALDLLRLGGDYLRACDDIMDKGLWDSGHILNAFALAVKYYSHPFYRRHINQLQMLALVATNLWEKSIDWETHPEVWKRSFADVLRHADVLMMSGIAMICRDWDAARDVTSAFLSAGFVDHLDRYHFPSDQKYRD
jgi:hypothetical protein